MFRFKPEEFIVEEIAWNGVVLERGKEFNFGKEEDQSIEKDFFTHFIMQKTEWNTLQALGAIASRLHVKHSRFNFAGTKDRNAVTTQLCSAFAVPPERLKQAKVKDIQVNGCWKAKEKVRLGGLVGNRFTIELNEQNCSVSPSVEEVVERARSLKYCFPNFFGAQRFGSMRQNTDKVGVFMLKEDFKGAVLEFLTGIGSGESATAVEARGRLAGDLNFSEALKYFPESLRYEKVMLEHLSNNKADFIGALRKLPRMLQMTFIHAVQSRIFNNTLEERLSNPTLQKDDWICEANAFDFPDVDASRKALDVEKEGKLVEKGKLFLVGKLVGYETKPSEREQKLLEDMEISTESFKLKRMPELSSKGSLRTLFVCLRGFEVLNDKPLTLRFSLQSGAYATTALEFLLGNQATE